LIQGIGELPTPMDTYTLQCNLGKTKNGVVEFENPFLESVSVSVKLITKQGNDINLMTTGKPIFLAALKRIPIQMVYKPKNMVNNEAVIVLETSRNISCTIPLKVYKLDPGYTCSVFDKPTSTVEG
jgi:hypothetical protein